MKIELENISVSFGKKQLFNSINLTLPTGKFIVILGPSGSGKTTLLRVLAGLQEPITGQIRFDEQDVTRLPANKRNVALVFQNYPLFPHMTIEENLRFPLESRKKGNVFKRPSYSKEEMEAKILSMLNLLHMEEHRHKYPHQLSGGEKQRIAIGREIIREPTFYLYDEPLSNIDMRLRFEMRTWIRKLHQILGKTTVYVTHDQNEAMALGEQIILMNEGEIVQIGTPEELYYHPQTKFVATFIGNYPMNFLAFRKEERAFYLETEEKELELSEKLQNIVKENDLKRGELGFRAESIKEYDKSKPISKTQIPLIAEIKDTEQILDKQIISLEYNGKMLYYSTRTKKIFQVGETLTILLNLDECYIFDQEEKNREQA